MFFAMTPDMIKHLNDLKKKAPMSFEAYYNKRFMEECKYFVENPKFSIKYAMVMSYLRKDIREKARKEYKEKWPGSPIEESNNKFPYVHTVKPNYIINNYDIISEEDVENENEDNIQNLRRSKRLLNNANK